MPARVSPIGDTFMGYAPHNARYRLQLKTLIRSPPLLWTPIIAQEYKSPYLRYGRNAQIYQKSFVILCIRAIRQ
jgi:hypothetical protein